MSSEPSGFIEDFSETVLTRIPTSPTYVENIALTLESVVLGKVKLPNKYGYVKLSIGSLMVGPSGLAYKSLPQSRFMKPVIKKVSGLLGLSLLLPARFTVEGMIECLAKVDGNGNPYRNQGVIARDEFTGMFSEFRGMDWLNGAMEFLSEMLDNNVGERYTRKTKAECPDNLHISLISATTPYFYYLLDDYFFMQGTGNRFLYNIYDGPNLDNVDLSGFFEERWELEWMEKLSVYAKTLAGIYKSNLRKIRPSLGAGKIWIEYKKSNEEECQKKYKDNPYDLEYSYLHRLPEQALRFAGFKTVSDGWRTLPKIRSSELPILEPIMEWGINKARYYYDEFLKLMKGWKNRPKRKDNPPKTDEADKREILRHLKPLGMTSMTHLATLTGYNKGSPIFCRTLASLMSEEKIRDLEEKEVKEVCRTKAKAWKQKRKIGLFRGNPPRIFEFLED